MKPFLRTLVVFGVLFGSFALALTQNDYGDIAQAKALEEGAAAAAEEHAGEGHAAEAHPAEAHPAAEAHGEHGAAGGHEGKHDVAGEVAEHILHHVSDGDEFEMEIPFPPFHAFTIHLGEIFAPLLIERVPGACSTHATGALAPFPSLAKAIAGCVDLRPSKAILMMWLAMLVLGVVLFFGNKRDQNGVPRGLFTNVVESLVLFVRDDIAVANIGKEEGPKYTPYLATVFFFIMFMNYIGLIPGMFAGTGVLAVTIALALITFVVTQIAGIRSAGLVGWFSHLFGDVPVWMKPIMFVVEFIGLFTKPFALLVRLFANMLAGHLVLFFLLSLIFVWHVAASVLSVPMAAAIYMLELFVAILQAYVFTLLTALFIGQSVALGHHAHGHDEHAH